MPRTTCDPMIGKRAHEEVLRIFPKQKYACEALGIGGDQLCQWRKGTAPSAKYLAALHRHGADVIYILTGRRSTAGGTMALIGADDRLRSAESAQLVELFANTAAAMRQMGEDLCRKLGFQRRDGGCTDGKPQTNAERFQQLAQDKRRLAVFLYRLGEIGEVIPFCKELPECRNMVEFEELDESRCLRCLQDWLEAPAKEEYPWTK